MARRQPKLALAVLALAAVPWLSDCSGSDATQTTPNTTQHQGELEADPQGTEPNGCRLPSSLGAVECDSCLERSCCTALSACTADVECALVFDCFSACSLRPEPDVCPGRCFDNGAPPPRFESVLECLIERCENECAPPSAQ